jgi:aryl-alcohol dehydrogenase-like predicted oxidoreductase
MTGHFVVAQPQIDVALSGAATTRQIASHAAGVATTLDDATVGALATFGDLIRVSAPAPTPSISAAAASHRARRSAFME